MMLVAAWGLELGAGGPLAGDLALAPCASAVALVSLAQLSRKHAMTSSCSMSCRISRFCSPGERGTSCDCCSGSGG